MIAAVSSGNRRRRRVTNAIATSAIIVAGIGVIVPLLAILLFLLVRGLPALNLDLFVKSPGPTGVP